MMHVRPCLALAALTVVLIPASLAGHGGPYNVQGTACRDEPVGCYDAHLYGQVGSLVADFRIELTDPESGASLPPLLFDGREEFRDLFFVQPHAECGALERFDYVAVDEATEGVVFEVTGALSLCIGGDHAYHGTLRGHFLDFELVLPFPFPEQA